MDDQAAADPTRAEPSRPARWWPVVAVAVVVGGAPWAEGAVDAGWTAAFALATAAALLGSAILGAACAPRSLPRWAVGAWAALVGFGFLQVLPLGSVAGWIAAEALSARAPYVPAGVPPLTTIALYPYATRLAALGIAVGVALAFLTARSCRDPRRAEALLGALTLAAAAMAVFGTCDRLLAGAPRATGAFRSPNHYAAYLAMFVPASLALAQRDGARLGASRRALWLLATGALLIGVLVSVSRSGLIAAVVGVGVYLGLTVRGEGRRALLTGVAAAGLLLLVGVEAVAERFGRLATEPGIGRVAFWVLGLKLFAQYPLVGAGWRSHDQLTPAVFENPRLLNATHNDYVNLLCDVGLVGAALAACGAWAVGREVRARLREAAPGSTRRWAAAAAAGCVALLVISLVEFNLQIRANLWAFCVLVGVALAVGRGEPSTSRRGLAATRTALALGATLLFVNAAPIGVSRALTARGDFAAAEPWAPENALIPTLRVGPLLDRGRVSEAIEAGRRACGREPRNAVHHNHLARALLAAGRHEDAREELRRAAQLAPHFPPARLHNARLWWWLSARTSRVEDRGRGADSLRAALEGDPDLVDPACDALIALGSLTATDLERALPSATLLRRRVALGLRARGAIAAAATVVESLAAAGVVDDRLLLAHLRLEQGRSLDAALEFSQAIAEAPPVRRDAAIRTACAALLGRGQAELTERLCREVLTHAPSSARARLELGRALIARKRAREAIEPLTRASALGLTESLEPLGVAHWAAGEREQALAVWERGLTAALSTTAQQAIRMRLAQAYQVTGRRPEAIRLLRLVVALDPEHARARALLKELNAQ